VFGRIFGPSAYSGCGVGYGHSDAASLVADFVLGDAGVAARLAVDAVRLLGFGGGLLRQELINCLRASPLMPLACELQSFILCC